jgi:hypothetical protein
MLHKFSINAMRIESFGILILKVQNEVLIVFKLQDAVAGSAVQYISTTRCGFSVGKIIR